MTAASTLSHRGASSQPNRPAPEGAKRAAGPGTRTSVELSRPRLLPGTELLGQFQGSGYQQAPYLVRRPDGQMLQLTRLTYLVLDAADGSRASAEIAAAVSGQTERPIGTDGVQYLLDNKLAPLGLVGDGVEAVVAPTANPILALRGRVTLVNARWTNRCAAVLRPLYYPVVVAAVILGLGSLDYWLFFQHGLGSAVHELLATPTYLLAILALTLVSAGFHELGHATACRYGGARPGNIGVGLYLIWPSFFTNVTDAYRLGRAGRLRTDLGGVYFNGVYILLLGGLYAITHQPALLLVILLVHVEMVEQLMPFLRFDGYYIVSDLVGMPDLFARIGPVLAHTLRRGGTDPRVSGLRRSSRILVSVWTLLTVPLLTVNIGYLLFFLPTIDGALWHSAWREAGLVEPSIHQGAYAATVLAVVSILLLGLSVAGTLYITIRVAGQVGRAARRWAGTHMVREFSLGMAAATTVVGLVAFWVSQQQFHYWHA